MIPIVYNHTHFIVVNKPVDIGMHASSNLDKTELGIADLLCQLYNFNKLYLVHRLDTHTSGTMVLAKSKPAAHALSKLFEARKVTKYYIALLAKKPKKKQGKVQGKMEKARNGSYKLMQKSKESKESTNASDAISFFFTQPYPQQQTSINEVRLNNCSTTVQPNRMAIVKPITGKTHQIRVAMKSLGSPILGDKRYKGEEADRLYLHSAYLSFNFESEEYIFKTLPQSGNFFDQTRLSELPEFNNFAWPKYAIPSITPLINNIS